VPAATFRPSFTLSVPCRSSARLPSRQTGDNLALSAAALSLGTTEVSAHGRIRSGHAPVRATGAASSGDAAKPVLVVGLPANAPDADERNAAAMEAVARLSDDLPVRFVPYPELTTAHVCFDGLHPSSTGYRAVARALCSELAPLMRGVEATMAVSGRVAGGDAAAATRVLRKRLDAHARGDVDDMGDHDGVAEALGAKLTRRRAGLGRDTVVQEAMRALGHS